MSIKGRVEIKDLSEWDKISQYIKKNLVDRHYTIFICDEYPLATMSQRGYLFGVVLKIISQETGHEIPELFEHYKNKYGDPFHEEITYDNEKRLSTKLYSTKKMSEFTEKIVIENRQEGMIIPDPNQIPDETYIKLMID